MEHLPIAEAAKALGCSPNAVRQRIRRGTLVAAKVGEQWYVDVASRPTPLRPTSANMPADLLHAPTATAPADVGRVPLAEDEAVAALVELLQEERTERHQERTRGIALDDQLRVARETAAMWQERARNLESEVGRLQQLLALPAHEEERPPRRRWWPWRRERNRT